MERIRRSRDEVDSVFATERPKRFPMKIDLSVEGKALQLRAHRTRWASLDYEPVPVRKRTTSAMLHVDGNHVGSFRLHEYDLEPLTDGDEFFCCMDNYSESASHLATVLCMHWEELFELTDYGPVVEFERAWMAPRYASRSHFAAASKCLLKMTEDCSIVVLRAFPLEYNGRVNEGNALAHRRRQRALIRLYRSTLGVVPFPGKAGADGWMYAIPERLKDIVPQPKECQLALA